jgi:hypothetical protein
MRLEVVMITVIGKSIAISTSKIKKITAIKKNRREKGSRADLFGSNPHSNGELFSRSSIIFFESSVVNIMIINERTNDIVNMVVIIIIIYSAITGFLIGSQIYSIY